MNEYIDIDKESIPYSFEMELSEEVFEFEVNYNESFDFFTVDLFKNGEPLVLGEKLVLNKPLFENRVSIDLPKVRMIPKDRAGATKRITFSNLNETVFLFVGEDNE
jgi:hypothetical protein